MPGGNRRAGPPATGPAFPRCRPPVHPASLPPRLRSFRCGPVVITPSTVSRRYTTHSLRLGFPPRYHSNQPSLSFKPAGGCWCYFEVSAIAEFEHGKETEAEAGCCEGLDGEERVFENSSKLSPHDRGNFIVKWWPGSQHKA